MLLKEKEGTGARFLKSLEIFRAPKSNIGTLYLDCSCIQQRYQLKAWGDKKKL